MITNPSEDIGFQSIIDESNDAVLVTVAQVDSDEQALKIVYVNNAMEALSGYQRHELVGQTLRILESPRVPSETRYKLKKNLTKKESFRCNYPCVKKSGEVYWVELNVIPIKNIEGEVTHFAAIQKEITNNAFDAVCRPVSLQLGNLVDSEFFTLALNKEWQRAYRHHTTFCIIAFKLIPPSFLTNLNEAQINELKQLSSKLFRLEDTVCLESPSEYTALLPETDEFMANLVIDRLKGQVEDSAIFTGCVLKVGTSEMSILDRDSNGLLIRARDRMNS